MREILLQQYIDILVTVKWQVRMALLVYVLLRFQAWRSGWAHGFSRLHTHLRAAL